MDVVCPKCGQVIRNAVANAANKIKCGACAFSISMPTTVTQPADPTAADSRVQNELNLPTNSPQSANDPITSTPLREPPVANYGMLSAAAWIGLAVGTLLAGADLYLNGSKSLGIARNAWMRPTFLSSGVSRVFMLAMAAVTGLVFIRIAERLTRIDRLTAAFAWRKSRQTLVLKEMTGSSLPYMLPAMVIGGVTLIIGMLIICMDTSASGREDGLAPIVGALCCSTTGVGIFAIGLAFSELRRLLWRMTQIGAAIPATAGSAPGSENTVGLTAAIANNSLKGSHYIFTAIVLLALSPIPNEITGSSNFSALWPAAGMLLMGALVLWSGYRISVWIDLACTVWRAPTERSTASGKSLRVCLWIMLGSLLMFVLREEYWSHTLQLLAAAAAMLFFYAMQVKTQIGLWLQRVEGLTGQRSERANGDRLAYYACTLALLCGISRCVAQFDELSVSTPDILAAGIGLFVFAAAPSWLAAWFGFVLNDLAKIESHLQSATAEETVRVTTPALSAPAAPARPAPASV